MAERYQLFIDGKWRDASDGATMPAINPYNQEVHAQVPVATVADVLLVPLGYSEEHPDHAHRQARAEVGDEIEIARSDQGIEFALAIQETP